MLIPAPAGSGHKSLTLSASDLKTLTQRASDKGHWGDCLTGKWDVNAEWEQLRLNLLGTLEMAPEAALAEQETRVQRFGVETRDGAGFELLVQATQRWGTAGGQRREGADAGRLRGVAS